MEVGKSQHVSSEAANSESPICWIICWNFVVKENNASFLEDHELLYLFQHMLLLISYTIIFSIDLTQIS